MSRVPGRPRAVFDCNALIQAIAYPEGPAAACLRWVESGRVELFVSKAGLRELRRVLSYNAIRQLSPNMNGGNIRAFLQRLEYRATLVRHVPHKFVLPRDPRDEPYIDLAAATRADFLVSCDNDLLSLMTDHSNNGKRFRRMTHPLQVVDPPMFLAAMKELGSPAPD